MTGFAETSLKEIRKLAVQKELESSWKQLKRKYHCADDLQVVTLSLTKTVLQILFQRNQTTTTKRTSKHLPLHVLHNQVLRRYCQQEPAGIYSVQTLLATTVCFGQIICKKAHLPGCKQNSTHLNSNLCKMFTGTTHTLHLASSSNQPHASKCYETIALLVNLILRTSRNCNLDSRIHCIEARHDVYKPRQKSSRPNNIAGTQGI